MSVDHQVFFQLQSKIMQGVVSSAGAIFLFGSTALAQVQTEVFLSDTLSQVTSVSQLSDVQPSDWAFQALQSLVERYGCIVGYPDQSFRGDRPLTRYEFAAGLNACLDRVNDLIASGTVNLATQEELATLQRLQEEFAAELATLRERVDSLEAGTAKLEANQFSTTTRLTGQTIFAVNGGGFDGDQIVDPAGNVITGDEPNITALYRVALDFNTSFTGADLLKLRIDVGSNGANDNAAGVLEPNFGSVLDYSVKPPSDGDFNIGRLYYNFQPVEDLSVSIGPNIRTTDYVDRNSYANLSFRDFSTLALVNNFILFPINGPSSGVAIDWNPGDGAFSIRALYAAADASNPGDERQPIQGTSSFTRVLYPNSLTNPQSLGDRGLFGATYQGTVEVEYAPSRNLALRLQYSGGEIFDNRFDVFGVNAEFQPIRGVAIFGRYGFGEYNNTAFGDVNPDYWMAGIAFPDLFKQGALGGLAAGQPFIEAEIGNATQTNFEAFYNFPVNDNIRITPTVQVITNAANQDENGTIITGTLRTVFSF
ncbi:MAG TPA: S-layer protein [Cyanobacteria bacterium UBA8553]|nr:S-layer protein [Cyanobacteria bacterium UBA8553]HAJ59326.1 S-layer protein [Cyanobacteria bacterium UBA8543]